MLSHLELVKLQHLLSDIHEDQLLLNNSDIPLAEFDPFSYQSTCGDSCLHIAVWRSNLLVIRLLLKGGADVNSKGDNGYTPLDCALSQNDGDVVSCLIENGGIAHVCKEQVRKWIKDKIN